jgi:hypothetical protein
MNEYGRNFKNIQYDKDFYHKSSPRMLSKAEAQGGARGGALYIALYPPQPSLKNREGVNCTK